MKDFISSPVGSRPVSMVDHTILSGREPQHGVEEKYRMLYDGLIREW